MGVPKKKRFESKSAYKERLQSEGYTASQIMSAIADSSSGSGWGSWGDSGGSSGGGGSCGGGD